MSNKIEYKNIQGNILSFERKAESDGRLLVQGYGATFGNVDSYLDTINKGAFNAGTDTEDWKRVAFCNQHDMRQPIGEIKELKEDDKGLYFEVLISKSEEAIAIKIEEGILKEFSIGYISKKYTIVEQPEAGEADRILEEIKLYEISVVTRAADANALIQSTERKEELFKEMTNNIEDKSIEELEALSKLAEKANNEIKDELNKRLILTIKL